jgi:hypothetical protein
LMAGMTLRRRRRVMNALAAVDRHAGVHPLTAWVRRGADSSLLARPLLSGRLMLGSARHH